MDDLIAFLGEQLTARAAQAPDIHTAECGYDMLEFQSECRCGEPDRVLADVAAKRAALDGYLMARRALNAAVDRHLSSGLRYHGDEVALFRLPRRDSYELAVKFAALSFAGHPEYQEAWKP